MIPSEVLSQFETLYPFSSFLIPAVYTILFLLIVSIAAKYIMSKDSFARIGAGLGALILGFAVFGVSVTGAMESQATPEHLISGKIIDSAESGNVSVVENNIVDTQVVLFETLDGGLMGPIEITTGQVEKAVGKVVTLSCELPSAAKDKQIISCNVIAIA